MLHNINRIITALALLAVSTATAWAQSPSGNWNDWVESNNIDWTSAAAKAAAIPQSDDGSTVYISTAEQLAYYAYAVNNDKQTSGSASGYYCGRTVELLADIDLSAHYWKPIGYNKNYYFNGYFHGNGHVITGMHVNGNPQSDNTNNLPGYGLFGYLHTRSGGTSSITDLVLKDFSVTASYSGNNSDGFYLGGLVGRCDDNTAITNCLLVNGSVSKYSNNTLAHIGKVVGGGSPSTATANYYHNVSVSGWLSGCDSYAQQTIGGEAEARTVALTVSGTHGSVALGGTVGVISDGIIYAPSGQTVTLNATADAGYMASLAATGLTLTSGQFTMPANDDGTITATFSIDPTHFSQSGTEYTIHTAAGWSVFCDCLDDNDTYNRFSGKTVKLADDITVTRMAGTSKHDFCGTFDGQGHTLTFTYGTADAPSTADYVAPFSYVSNTKADPNDESDSPVAIRNLHVSGDIYTSGQQAGGIIARKWGTVSITNCRSSVNIHSTHSGDGTHGGLVACINNGALTIEGCLFDGSLLGASTNCVGGFIGWRAGGAEIRNSLFAPTEVTVSTSGSATFARNTVDCYNSYYTYLLNDGTNYAPSLADGTVSPAKWYNGKATRTVSGGEHVTTCVAALGGTQTAYTVSGITAYADGGLRRGDNLYYGSGDQLSLTLANDAPDPGQGYQYGYTATAGTLSGNATDGYTLQMPDQNVTVNVGDLRSDGQSYDITYMKADGTTDTNAAIALDGTETNLGVAGQEKWYFIGTDISHNGEIDCCGNVNIILADGKTMTLTHSSSNGAIWGASNSTINIYGQTNGTGILSITGTNCNGIITNGDIAIHGGTVNATAANESGRSAIVANGTLTITGGTVNADANTASNGLCGTAVVITGGKVTATGGSYSYGISSSGTITLGWTNPDDYIHVSSCSPYNGTVKIADGQALVNAANANDIYSGTVADASALAGKTLVPFTGMTIAAKEATVNSETNYWTTYYNGNVGLKIADEENACAYTATYSVESEVGTITLHRLGKVIPAGTAVIIVGVDDEVSMKVSTAAAEETVGNKLHGLDAATPIGDVKTACDNADAILMLSNKNGNFGFHEVSLTNIPANKAFLALSGTAAMAREFTIVFDEATAIKAIDGRESGLSNSAVYTLDGRKVADFDEQSPYSLPKGIYIVNGRKVVIK